MAANQRLLTEPAAAVTPPLTASDVAGRHNVGWRAVHAWADRGVLVNGTRVKLRAYKIGGSLRITEEALAAFVAACNPAAGEPLPNPAPEIRRGKASQQRLAERLAT